LSAERYDVCVVGGGVIGLCTAYQLSKKKYRVAILERADWMASEASSNNGGATWPFNQMISEPFMYRFILDSVEAHKRLGGAGLKYDFRKIGCIFLLYNDEQRRSMEEKLNAMPSTESYQFLTRDEVSEREPALTSDIEGAILFPNCSHGEAHKLCIELIREVKNAGVTIKTSTTVKGFSKDSGRILGAITTGGEYTAEHFVLAAGPWSGAFSDDLGFGIPTIPIKGHIISWKTEIPLISHMVWTGRAAIFPGSGTIVQAGGGMDFTGFDKTPSERTRRLLSASAIKAIPRLASLSNEVWTGLRPGTPDALPIIGYAESYGNLIVATGHYHEGFTTAPLTGEIVRDLIVKGTSDLPYLNMYRPGRFNC
jgi:glycine oxidase